MTNQPTDIKREGISGMRKIEVITLFNANCLEIPNNSLSLTHSLTHSLTIIL